MDVFAELSVDDEGPVLSAMLFPGHVVFRVRGDFTM